MQDGELPPARAERLEALEVGILAELCRQLVQKPSQRVTKLLELGATRRVEPRLARVLYVLGALEHLVEVRRQLAAGAEEVDLHDQGGKLRRIVEDVPERRIGHQPAVPIMDAVDDRGRKTRRQRAAGDDVRRSDRLSLAVEVDRVARVDVHSA